MCSSLGYGRLLEESGETGQRYGNIEDLPSNPVSPLISIVAGWLSGVKNRGDIPNELLNVFYEQTGTRKVLPVP